ncbi:uncharacterized protein LOC127104162 [Lathyrus oleraceus]|uniref:uncharacterized protein LOC127104162 n=1 Tax=Pisum sativum TaxID=3888 RepID=UPI0021D0329A|nr:uncharacterized protein LOC127104162 [Pisum sativum]
MAELEALKRILTYVTEKKIKLVLEAEENMVVEAYVSKKEDILAIEPEPPDKSVVTKGNVNMQCLDCIYDDEPLGFEKDPRAPEEMRLQDPLEEVDLGENGDKRPTYISANIDKELKSENEDFKWQEEHQEAFDKIKEYLTKPPVLAPPVRNMPMRYSDIEKLCLCLYFSCMKLKQYIKPVDVYVSSHFDIIKHMLSKPILNSRIGKWALALTEYSLTYVPLKAMKGQVVADFLVDHSMVELPQNYVDTVPWRLYFDGSRHKNGSGMGGVIISPDGIPAEFNYIIEGVCTNNEAEYESLITGLEFLLESGARNVKIMGDFELVIKQVSKEYRCVKENLIMYFVITIRLLKRFDQVSLQHIPRKENQRANDLAQEASVYKASKD